MEAGPVLGKKYYSGKLGEQADSSEKSTLGLSKASWACAGYEIGNRIEYSDNLKRQYQPDIEGFKNHKIDFRGTIRYFRNRK